MPRTSKEWPALLTIPKISLSFRGNVSQRWGMPSLRPAIALYAVIEYAAASQPFLYLSRVTVVMYFSAASLLHRYGISHWHYCSYIITITSLLQITEPSPGWRHWIRSARIAFSFWAASASFSHDISHVSILSQRLIDITTTMAQW